MSKGGFMKDAVILCAITLVAGACLGGVYEMTKAPIDAANLAAKGQLTVPYSRTQQASTQVTWQTRFRQQTRRSQDLATAQVW
mgnify:CR=1 FL=1